jgi:hypothetical protein
MGILAHLAILAHGLKIQRRMNLSRAVSILPLIWMRLSGKPSQSSLVALPKSTLRNSPAYARPPAEVPRDRWHQFINDAGLFLDRWGRQAEAFGWRADELFGLHPDAPMARYDRMGLIWMLRGETVLDISETAARLSGGLAIYRKATA